MNEADPAIDWTVLDHPALTGRMFYPRRDLTPAPRGAHDLAVAAADGVALQVRWHPAAAPRAALLFFHGNGEVAADYDDLAPVYHHLGLSFGVAEFRGYGQSGGQPRYSFMMADAPLLARAFLGAAAAAHGDGTPALLMGRSMGAHSAIRLAATAGMPFRGLILESGAAGARGWHAAAPPEVDRARLEQVRAARLAELRAITLPLLSIHGAWDELIPADTAREVQELVGSSLKRLLIVPGAGHNDLLSVAPDRYFAAIDAFVSEVLAG